MCEKNKIKLLMIKKNIYIPINSRALDCDQNVQVQVQVQDLFVTYTIIQRVYNQQ